MLHLQLLNDWAIPDQVCNPPVDGTSKQDYSIGK